ncbi:MAG: thioredoxin family protein [Candidatus Babeliales bacterium]
MPIPFTQDLIASKKPVVIKAFATWCPHCKKMAPLFEELEKELSHYIFAEFDVDKHVEFTEQFHIESLPTFIFIKNGNEVGRTIGEMPKDELKEAIEHYLK